MLHEELTEKIIGCAFKVSNALGCGFLEKVYENALVHELRKAGLSVQQQVPLKVHYDGIIVGEYVVDLMVEGAIILELKAIANLDKVHMAIVLNYLKATNTEIALLLNFGKPRMEYKRIIAKGVIE